MVDIAALPDYTDADLLKAMRYGYAQLAFSQAVTIAGRTITRAQLPQLRQEIVYLENRIAAAGSPNAGIALATLNPQEPGRGMSATGDFAP